MQIDRCGFFKRVSAVALAASLALCSACVTSRALLLPEDLRDEAERYSVAGQVDLFTHKVTFGPYTATKVWIHGEGSSEGATALNGGTERIDDHEKGSFELSTASGVFRGKCDRARVAVAKHETGWELSGHDGKTSLHSADRAHVTAMSQNYRCVLSQPSAPDVPFQFVFGEPGRAYGGDVDIVIAPLQGGPSERPRLAYGLVSGFVLSEGEQALAVVDIDRVRGSVTLARSLPQRRKDQVAALAMELLLLRGMN